MEQDRIQAFHAGRNVRRGTLRLRWLAVIGQTTAVLVFYLGLDFELPIWACPAVTAFAAWLNVALRLQLCLTQRVELDRAAWLLAFDIGRAGDPPVPHRRARKIRSRSYSSARRCWSATALPSRLTLMLGGSAAACVTVLIFVHSSAAMGCRSAARTAAHLARCRGLASLLLAIGFIGAYAWQLTEEALRQLADALAATELKARARAGLSQLDGLPPPPPPTSSARRSPPSR